MAAVETPLPVGLSVGMERNTFDETLPTGSLLTVIAQRLVRKLASDRNDRCWTVT